MNWICKTGYCYSTLMHTQNQTQSHWNNLLLTKNADSAYGTDFWHSKWDTKPRKYCIDHCSTAMLSHQVQMHRCPVMLSSIITNWADGWQKIRNDKMSSISSLHICLPMVELFSNFSFCYVVFFSLTSFSALDCRDHIIKINTFT